MRQSERKEVMLPTSGATDDSSNVQTQTLSPAFRVDSLAGIEEVSLYNTDNSRDIQLYDLQGSIL